MCAKNVYANDPQLVLDGSQYHKACAKCAEPRCGVQLGLGNFAISGEELLCKTHMKERFLLKGQYAGGEKFAQESPRDLSTTHLFILSCQVPIAAATAAAVLKLQEKGAADRQVARVAAVAAAEEAAATASVQNSSSSSSSSGGGGGGGLVVGAAGAATANGSLFWGCAGRSTAPRGKSLRGEATGRGLYHIITQCIHKEALIMHDDTRTGETSNLSS